MKMTLTVKNEPEFSVKIELSVSYKHGYVYNSTNPMPVNAHIKSVLHDISVYMDNRRVVPGNESCTYILKSFTDDELMEMAECLRSVLDE